MTIRLLRIIAMIAAPVAAALRSAALELVVVPLAVVLLQWAFVGPILASSRDRAIVNAGRLIVGIERFHSEHGRYPASLLSLWEDYPPGSIGIRRYQYEPYEDAYNLGFEHPSLVFGTNEIVVYNPRDRQVFTSHDADLLEWTGEDLRLRRGFYSVHDLPQPHWKRFRFD